MEIKLFIVLKLGFPIMHGFILTTLLHILCLHKPNENTDVRENELSTSNLSLIIIHLETEGISSVVYPLKKRILIKNFEGIHSHIHKLAPCMY